MQICPKVSTHVCSYSSLSRGSWNRAILARHMGPTNVLVVYFRCTFQHTQIIACERCDVAFSGMLWSFVPSLCSPNEDVGNRNKRFAVSFRSSFQWILAQIKYSNPWKVPRKCACHLLFILPKSSLGEHKFTDPEIPIFERISISVGPNPHPQPFWYNPPPSPYD